jgi:phosphoserine phosphatase
MELSIPAESKLVLIALDDIIIEGSLLQSLADAVGRGEEMAALIESTVGDPDKRAVGAGQVLRGVHKQEIEQVALRIPLCHGIVGAMVELRRAGLVIGLVSCGFQIAADIIRRRVFADISLSNMLNFRAGQATGQVPLCSPQQPGCARHMACSGAMAEGLLRSSNIAQERLIAVAASREDICLLGSAGKSVGYGSASSPVAGLVDRLVEPVPTSLAQLLITGAFIATPSNV